MSANSKNLTLPENVVDDQIAENESREREREKVKVGEGWNGEEIKTGKQRKRQLTGIMDYLYTHIKEKERKALTTEPWIA